jgi:hypothetical protein
MSFFIHLQFRYLAERRGERPGETPAAPKAILIYGLKAQSGPPHLAHCFSHLSRSAPWNPRQVAAQNEDSERRSHQKRTYPEAPVTMHTSPVRTRIGFTAVAAVSFPVVPVSRHLFSISAWHSPRRAAGVISPKAL